MSFARAAILCVNSHRSLHFNRHGYGAATAEAERCQAAPTAATSQFMY